MRASNARTFAFEVPGPALPWQRTNIVHGRPVTPKGQKAYQNALRWTALAVRPKDWNLHARYRVSLVARYADARGRDLDNLQKQCGDALNEIAWADDSRIVEWRSVFGRTSMSPKLVVVIEYADPEKVEEMALNIEAQADRLRSVKR